MQSPAFCSCKKVEASDLPGGTLPCSSVATLHFVFTPRRVALSESPQYEAPCSRAFARAIEVTAEDHGVDRSGVEGRSIPPYHVGESDGPGSEDTMGFLMWCQQMKRCTLLGSRE